MIKANTWITLLLSFWLINGCESNPDTTNTPLTISVVDSKQRSISGAAIKLNQKSLGSTNRDGFFTKIVSVPLGSGFSIVIEKSSEQHYFAPFKKTYGKMHAPVQPLNIHAVLYSVPKQMETGKNIESSDMIKMKNKVDLIEKDTQSFNISKTYETNTEESLELLSQEDPPKTQKIDLHEADHKAKITRKITVETWKQEYTSKDRLKGVSIEIDGRLVGQTARNGIFSYSLPNESPTKISVKLRTDAAFPKEFELELNTEHSNLIKKMYTTTESPLKPTILITHTNEAKINKKKIDQLIGSYKQAMLPHVNIAINKDKPNLAAPLNHDYIIKIRFGKKKFSAALMDKSSYSISTTTATFENINKIDWVKTGREMSQRTLSNIPFSGHITDIDETGISINLGKSMGAVLGSKWSVTSTIQLEDSLSYVPQKIGTLRIIETNDQFSVGKITDFNSTHKVKVGDFIQKEPSSKTQIVSAINLKTHKKEQKAAIQEENFPIKSQIRVVIHSIPMKAPVHLQGKLIGKTPLKTSIGTSSQFTTLEIGPIPGFKISKKIVSARNETISYTGKNIVRLEKNYYAQAEQALRTDQVEKAMAIVNKIPSDHSDYLSGQHLLGEIYLNKLNSPLNALKSFKKVTQTPAARNFNSKKFVPSHISEGISAFWGAENLQKTNPKKAIALYTESIKKLETVKPYLRFISSEHAGTARQKVLYHQTLAKQKLWKLSQNPQILSSAIDSWEYFLDEYASKAKYRTDFYLENARTYYKQAVAYANR